MSGPVIPQAPLFAGVDQVADPQDGARLIVSWKPATSLNPTAQIVYDVFREDTVAQGNGTQNASFTPSASNRVAEGLTGTSYNDTGLSLADVQYYIVQARDTNNNTLDTNNAGNTITKFNAPTVAAVSGTPVFALETFETTAANSRFTPGLTESGGDPDTGSPTFQRTVGEQFGGFGTAGKMFAPDFSPGHENSPANCATALSCGGASDFYTMIGGAGGLTLTPTSILEFDHSFNQEAFFDGGVLEIKVGAPFVEGDATPYPNNVNVYDLNNFTIEGNYNSALDAALQEPAPVRGSPLQGRLAYTGAKGLHHTRISLNDFAPGGTYNPNSQPVYIRFRQTSDAASSNGVDQGWYIDNVAINNLACLVNVAGAASGATANASSTASARNYSPEGAIDGDRKGASWESGGGWNDNTRDVWPDELTINFDGAQTISEVRVYTLQNDFRNPQEPTPLTPATDYGILNFEVQTCNGATCTTVPVTGTITGNDKAMRIITLGTPINATGVRIKVNNAREHFSRIVEVEAFGCK